MGLSVSSILHDLNNMIMVSRATAETIMESISDSHAASDSLVHQSGALLKSLSKTQEFQQLLLRHAKSTVDSDLQECLSIPGSKPLFSVYSA